MEVKNVRKKGLALALVFAMLVAMMSPTFAVEGEGSEDDVEMGLGYIIRDITGCEPDQVELLVDEDWLIDWYCQTHTLPGGISLYAYGPRGCGLGDQCTCAACDWYIGYGLITATTHQSYVYCTGCSAATDLARSNHSFSGDTCTDCGYTKPSCSHTYTYTDSYGQCKYANYCSDCGVKVGSAWTSHNYSAYSYSYTDSTTHTGTRTCTDCGTTSTTSGSHSTTNKYSKYSNTQHTVAAYCATCKTTISTSYAGHSFSYGTWTKVDNDQCSRSVSCSLCSYADTEYQPHADSDNDGLCNSCGANMNVDVTFQLYGTTSTVTAVQYGGAVSRPEDPTRPGYNFMEWVDESGAAYDFSTILYTAKTITATWEARDDTAYTVNHYQQNVEGDGYTLADTDHLTGTTDTQAIAEEKEYTGFHWLESHPDSTMIGNIDGTGSLVLDVYYERDAMTVSINIAGRTEDCTVRYGGMLAVPEEPTRAGYDFIKWLDAEGNDFDFNSPITGDITMTAAWAPRHDTPYHVEHYRQDVTGDGYTLADTDHLTGTTDTQATAEEKGYTGFHLLESHPDSSMTGSIEGTGSLILKVYYDRDPMTVSINIAGKAETVDIRYGGTLDVPEAPTRPGYDFVEWADGEGNEFDFSAPITGPVTLVAVWNARNDTPYTVEHYQQTVSGDYILVDTESLTGITDTIAIAVVRSFTGFHEAIGHADHATSGNIDSDGSRVLKVYYERDTVKVILDLEGASDACDVIYGGTLPVPETPVRPGYDFVTWLDTEGNEYDFDTPVMGDIQLKAAWAPRDDTPYQVRHYQQNVTGDGYTLAETEHLIGTTDTTATARVRSYTNFHSNEDHPDCISVGTIAGNGSLILSLYYDRDRMTVSVDLGNGEPLTQEIPYGGAIPKPDDPTEPGYIFTGWTDENGDPYDFDTPVTGAVVLIPSWQARPTPPKVEGTGLSGGETSLPWLADLGDTQLTRAQAVYVLTMLLNGEAEGMQLTIAFDDVSEDTEYAAFISWANGTGIVAGYGHRLFGPTDSLTREQLAIMLYRLYGDGSRADLTVYADHDSVSWWADSAVCWAVSKDLLPVEDGKLRPWDGVTGKELAALLGKAAELVEQEQ